MRDYQRIKNNQYGRPADVYRRALAHVRAYPHLCTRRREMLFAQQGAKWDPTPDKAIRLAQLGADIAVVEQALNHIPKEYRKGLMDNILQDQPMHHLSGACVETWSRWRRVLLWRVAKQMHWID